MSLDLKKLIAEGILTKEEVKKIEKEAWNYTSDYIGHADAGR